MVAKSHDRAQVVEEFHAAVNMTPSQLASHLASPESQGVGWKHEGEHEAVGHASGRAIVDLLEKEGRGDELTDDDVAHMKVGHFVCV